MGLFRVSYDKREDSLINAVTVGELVGEAPSVLAIRHDEQGRGYVMGSEGLHGSGIVHIDDGHIDDLIEVLTIESPHFVCRFASFHDDLAGHTGLGRRGMAPCCVQT